jgi:hypothetical protein
MMGVLLSVALPFALAGLATGCEEDDVKVVRQRETVHESQPEPVAPGEPIVE